MTLSTSSSRAVRTRTGAFEPAARSRRRTSKPSMPGQPHVEHHRSGACVGGEAPGPPRRLRATRDLVALLLEGVLDAASDGELVLDDQDGGGIAPEDGTSGRSGTMRGSRPHPCARQPAAAPFREDRPREHPPRTHRAAPRDHRQGRRRPAARRPGARGPLRPRPSVRIPPDRRARARRPAPPDRAQRPARPQGGRRQRPAGDDPCAAGTPRHAAAAARRLLPREDDRGDDHRRAGRLRRRVGGRGEGRWDAAPPARHGPRADAPGGRAGLHRGGHLARSRPSTSCSASATCVCPSV